MVIPASMSERTRMGGTLEAGRRETAVGLGTWFSVGSALAGLGLFLVSAVPIAVAACLVLPLLAVFSLINPRPLYALIGATSDELSARRANLKSALAEYGSAFEDLERAMGAAVPRKNTPTPLLDPPKSRK